jgi:hypothetical protein
MLVSDPNQQLDDLLGTSIAEFDMPDAVYARAVARYEHLARWLAGYWPESHAGGEVYPQGSIRLGTVTRPINPRDEYDIDLVCRRDLLVTATTKEGLKADVGRGLVRYVASGPDGAPRCSEGNRCWTLDYPAEPFHMDVLPTIPDVEARPNGILLTDRKLHRWQHSNPVDYATWFRGRMAAEYSQLREAAAVAKRMDVEDVPDWEVKTTLQRAVQALKRHRDIHFARSPGGKPASIVITTLAAMAYRGQASLFEVLVDVAGHMPDLVEDRAGILWIANPVQPEENFADRWRAHPERAQRFFDWIDRAQRDFTGLGEERGLDRIVFKLAESFGPGSANRAGERSATTVRKAREDGLLGISAGTGTLGAARTHPVPRHTFHGDAPPPAAS